MSALDDSKIEEAAEILRSGGPVMVFGHEWPDGDAIGSLLAVCLCLAKNGRRVTGSWPAPMELPGKYEFLPGRDLIVSPGGPSADAVVITVDCANIDRLRDLKEIALGGREIINIDHHPDNTGFGTLNLVDPGAASTSEIIYDAVRRLGVGLTLDAAICLYSGIVTDTGRFQFTNTTAETLRAASELVSLGVKPHAIYENIYQSDTLAYIRLTGEVLKRSVHDERLGLIYGWVTQEDLRSFKVRMSETEDLIDDLRTLRGHRIAALFKEQSGGTIRISLRSRADFDIGTIARRLGGGGHRVAAGYTSGRRTVADAVAELKEEIVASGGNTGSR